MDVIGEWSGVGGEGGGEGGREGRREGGREEGREGEGGREREGERGMEGREGGREGERERYRENKIGKKEGEGTSFVISHNPYCKGTSTSSDIRPSTSCLDNNVSIATTSATFIEAGAVLPGGREESLSPVPPPAAGEPLSPVAGEQDYQRHVYTQ